MRCSRAFAPLRVRLNARSRGCNPPLRPAFQAVKSQYCGGGYGAADSTANMLAELSDYLLEEKKTEQTRALFYAIGKWIYLIDALDDYDKDVKKGAYNPFVLAYGAESRAKLVENNGSDLEFIFNSLFYDIRENLTNTKLYFNRDLVDNVLLRGLPMMTKRITAGKGCKADKELRKHSRME